MIDASRVAKMHVDRNLIDRAVDHFGITSDFNKGVWLLPDGNLLNFSNGKDRLDHSDIEKIFPEELKKQNPMKYRPEREFVRDKFLDAGVIRLVPEGGGIEISKKPTERQFSTIGSFLKWLSRSEFFIDLSGQGQSFKKLYDNNPQQRAQALETIDRYFKGQLQSPSELQRFRYSDEGRRFLQEST